MGALDTYSGGVMQVACPTCQAQAGSRCTPTKRGFGARGALAAHIARRKLALTTKEEGDRQ